jgi:hypothetical protein
MNVEGLVLHVIIEDGPLHLEEANGSWWKRELVATTVWGFDHGKYE